MKNLATKALLLSTVLLSAQPVLADFTTVFNDPCTGDVSCSGWGTGYSTPGDGTTGTPQYYGGNGGASGGDILGDEQDFDILSMTVSQSGVYLVASILTRFVEGTSSANVLYGDLMLSTTGWHPTGSTPYPNDTASSPDVTNWNYVVQTTTGNIYHDASLENSDTAPNDGVWREDQYVRYASGGTGAGTASVSIDHPLLSDVADGTPDALEGTNLTYTIPLVDLGLPIGIPTDVGLRWTMTCANDIVEAAVNVNFIPEPSSLSLFLGGLAGLRLLRRSRLQGKAGK